MAKVAVLFKIAPAEGVDINSLQTFVKERAKDVEIEDIGFGIKFLKALFVLDDEGSALNEIEEWLNSSPLVSSTEVVSVNRLG